MRSGWILGAVIVLGLAVVASGQALRGTWENEFGLWPQSASFTWSSVLRAYYTISGWTFGSISELDDTGWVDQEFWASGALGLFWFTSALGFDPDAPAFEKWTSTATVTLAGVSFSSTFELYDGDAFWSVTGSGTTADISLSATLDFGDDDDPGECDLDFNAMQLSADFSFCCAEVESTVYFDCAGFDRIVFDVDDIPIPGIPWLEFDVTLEFTVQTKTLTLSPRLDFVTDICIDFYIGLGTTGNLILDDLYIDGFKLECDIGRVTFTAISFWGDYVTKPAELGDYWEMYRVAADDEVCCGSSEFEVAVFFHEESAHLFDVGRFTADLSFDVGTNLTFNLGFDYELAVGQALCTFGLLLSW